MTAKETFEWLINNQNPYGVKDEALPKIIYEEIEDAKGFHLKLYSTNPDNNKFIMEWGIGGSEEQKNVKRLEFLSMVIRSAIYGIKKYE